MEASRVTAKLLKQNRKGCNLVFPFNLTIKQLLEPLRILKTFILQIVMQTRSDSKDTFLHPEIKFAFFWHSFFRTEKQSRH